MKGFKEKTFTDRLQEAADARKAALERFRARPASDDPEVLKRREERLRIAEARAERDAVRKAQKEGRGRRPGRAGGHRAGSARGARAPGGDREGDPRRLRGGRAQGRAGRALCCPQDPPNPKKEGQGGLGAGVQIQGSAAGWRPSEVPDSLCSETRLPNLKSPLCIARITAIQRPITHAEPMALADRKPRPVLRWAGQRPETFRGGSNRNTGPLHAARFQYCASSLRLACTSDIRTPLEPKMAPFIFGARNNIHMMTSTWPAADGPGAGQGERRGGPARPGAVRRYQAPGSPTPSPRKRSAQYYINHRWLGGTLTNWKTIVQQSIRRLKQLDETLAEKPKGRTQEGNSSSRAPATASTSRWAASRTWAACRTCCSLFDTNKEEIAIADKRLSIPIVAIGRRTASTSQSRAMTMRAAPSRFIATSLRRRHLEGSERSKCGGRRRYRRCAKAPPAQVASLAVFKGIEASRGERRIDLKRLPNVNGKLEQRLRLISAYSTSGRSRTWTRKYGPGAGSRPQAQGGSRRRTDVGAAKKCIEFETV